MLPPKRKRQRSSIERAPKREWPKHRRWVKSHQCCVPHCKREDIDPHHVKTRGSGGADWDCVSLCRLHHDECHLIGTFAFCDKYAIDLWNLAAEFARRSPDLKMREAMNDRHP